MLRLKILLKDKCVSEFSKEDLFVTDVTGFVKEDLFVTDVTGGLLVDDVGNGICLLLSKGNLLISHVEVLQKKIRRFDHVIG